MDSEVESFIIGLKTYYKIGHYNERRYNELARKEKTIELREEIQSHCDTIITAMLDKNQSNCAPFIEKIIEKIGVKIENISWDEYIRLKHYNIGIDSITHKILSDLEEKYLPNESLKIKSLKNLMSLPLSKYKKLKLELENLDDLELIKFLDIHHLKIPGHRNLNDDHLKLYISQCKNLEHLDLETQYDITLDGLYCLIDCKNLKFLNLSILYVMYKEKLKNYFRSNTDLHIQFPGIENIPDID